MFFLSKRHRRQCRIRRVVNIQKMFMQNIYAMWFCENFMEPDRRFMDLWTTLWITRIHLPLFYWIFSELMWIMWITLCIDGILWELKVFSIFVKLQRRLTQKKMHIHAHALYLHIFAFIFMACLTHFCGFPHRKFSLFLSPAGNKTINYSRPLHTSLS